MSPTTEPRAPQRFDCREQLRLIHRHQQRLARRLGCAVDAETAALDWVTKHAASWRRAHEARAH
jgi:hypothetical protein